MIGVCVCVSVPVAPADVSWITVAMARLSCSSIFLFSYKKISHIERSNDFRNS